MSGSERTLTLGLGALVLLAATLLVPGPAQTPVPPLAPLLGGGLALAGLLAELSAVPLPGFGFFSPGFAFWFALALLPEPGPSLAVLAGAGALVLRSLLRGHESRSWRLREAVGDLFPLAAGLAALHFVDASGLGLEAAPLHARLPAILAGFGCFLFSAMIVPGLFAVGLGDRNSVAWGMVRERLGVPIAALPAAGALLAWLGQVEPWLLLPLGVLLLAVHRAASLGSSWARIEERRRLQRRLESATHKLGKAEEAQQRVRRELAVKVDEYALLEELASRLAGCTTVAETSAAVLDLVRRLVPARSSIVFLHRADFLVPVAWQSPHEELLASLALLRVREPVVERAWREGKPAHAKDDEVKDSPVIPDEKSRLAVPIPKHGVLYVGSLAPDAFGPPQARRLAIVAAQAALALQSTGRLEEREEALHRHAEAHQRLEVWVGGLEQVLQGLRGLLTSLEPEALLSHLGEVLQAVVPHDLRTVRAGDYRLVSGAEDAAAVDELAQVVRRNALPLLADDIGTTRFAPPGPGMRSVLAVPLNIEDGSVGAVVLGAREPGAFRREHQDLAFMLAYQVAAAFQNAELHRQLLVTHRALQESQAQLIQSSKMAAVGQLAAGVAHELNTPLGAILLGVDSALTVVQTRPERAVSRLETARKAVMQAREIVAKLLFYSRDARQGFRETDLNQVVEDTLELIGHHLRMDDIRVEKDLGDVRPIVANQNEVQQVLTNLVLNARDALAGATGERRVRLATRSEGNLAVVEVEDSGPGMPPEVRERIFEPFYTTKPVGQGTGLGLSVSLEIVKRHRGTVEVDSEPGRTCFTVRLAGGREGSSELLSPAPASAPASPRTT